MGYEIYTIDGRIAVDKICKFENLTKELEEVMKVVGIQEKLELPRAKSRVIKDKRHYQDILSEADKTIIAELFNDEINLLGYEW